MTYEENLRKTAEEMAAIAHPCIFINREVYPVAWEMIVDSWRNNNQAAYCLKKQAEAYREAIGSFYDGAPNLKILEAKLKVLGLIP